MDFSEKPTHQQYQYGDPSCDLLLFLLLQLLSLFGSYLVDKVYEHSCSFYHLFLASLCGKFFYSLKNFDMANVFMFIFLFFLEENASLFM